jgi:hypothetical protein
MIFIQSMEMKWSWQGKVCLLFQGLSEVSVALPLSKFIACVLKNLYP